MNNFTSRYPLSMTRIPAASLKSAPYQIDPSQHRIRFAFFNAPADTLPNGRGRQSQVACVCAFQLADQVHGWAQVERTEAGPLLAVEDEAIDMLQQRFIHMDYSLSVLHGLYHEMGRCYLLAQARHAQYTGRN
ncbi:MAG: hypothetical protein ACRYFS_16220 [Janthinobacterium lividum]